MRLMQFSTIAALMLAIPGCGGGGAAGPKVAPTGGVVKFDGKPVTNATINFYPQSGPAGIATSDAEGNFRIKTNGADGAVVGSHKVTVIDQPQEFSAEADGKEITVDNVKTTFPAKYRDAKTTDLVVTVPAEGNKALTLDLTQ